MSAAITPTGAVPGRRWRPSDRNRAAFYGKVLVLAAVAALLLFPLYWMVLTSLSPTVRLLSPKPNLLLDLGDLRLDGYRAALFERPVLRWLSNSAVITLGSAMIGTFVSVLAGYGMSRFRSFGQQGMGMALLLSRMLPGSLLVLPLYLTFLRIGLVNNLVALVIVNTVFIVPFASWMMRAFFNGIPIDLEEAAMVDGATRLQALRRVILPLTMPGLAAAFTYSSILAWGDFLFARTLLTEGDKWPITVGMVSFLSDYATDWNGLMAIGMIAVLPMAALFVSMERFLVSGMTSGSVKG